MTSTNMNSPCQRLLRLGLLLTALFAPAAEAQQLVITSHGISFGTSAGSTSVYRQESRSEANVLRQVLTLNASPLQPGSTLYRIDDPSNDFAVKDVLNSQAASETRTSANRSFQRGISFSVFTN